MRSLHPWRRPRRGALIVVGAVGLALLAARWLLTTSPFYGSVPISGRSVNVYLVRGRWLIRLVGPGLPRREPQSAAGIYVRPLEGGVERALVPEVRGDYPYQVVGVTGAYLCCVDTRSGPRGSAGAPALFRVALAGGACDRVATFSPASGVCTAVLPDGGLRWCSDAYGSAAPVVLMAAAPGARPRPLGTVPPDAVPFAGMVFVQHSSGGRLYWLRELRRGQAPDARLGCTLWSMPVDGGAPKAEAEVLPGRGYDVETLDIVPCDDGLYWAMDRTQLEAAAPFLAVCAHYDATRRRLSLVDAGARAYCIEVAGGRCYSLQAEADHWVLRSVKLDGTGRRLLDRWPMQASWSGLGYWGEWLWEHRGRIYYYRREKDGGPAEVRRVAIAGGAERTECVVSLPGGYNYAPQCDGDTLYVDARPTAGRAGNWLMRMLERIAPRRPRLLRIPLAR